MPSPTEAAPAAPRKSLSPTSPLRTIFAQEHLSQAILCRLRGWEKCNLLRVDQGFLAVVAKELYRRRDRGFVLNVICRWPEVSPLRTTLTLGPKTILQQLHP